MTENADGASRLEPLVRLSAEDIAEASRLDDYSDDYPGFDPLDSDEDDWEHI